MLFDKCFVVHTGRGSGVFGSIKSQDLAGLSSGPATVGAPADAPRAPQGGYMDIPVSNIRGVIAKRLKESKQQIPHYYVSVECNIDKVKIYIFLYSIFTHVSVYL